MSDAEFTFLEYMERMADVAALHSDVAYLMSLDLNIQGALADWVASAFTKNLNWCLDTMKKCESPIERSFVPALLGLRMAFPAPDFVIVEPQHEVAHRSGRSYRMDFLVHGFCKGHKFAIDVECDGHAFHELTKEQAHRDKQRDRDLQAMGYRVARFTGSELWDRNRTVAASSSLASIIDGIAKAGE